MSQLPFAAAADALRAAVHDHGCAIVESPPGSGKTTLAPQVIASSMSGRVVVTQPRRVAARAAARRIAAVTGTALGEYVGFTVRGERVVKPGARIEMVTPGVLLRRLLGDPSLDGVGAVILDEVHERGLDTDLLVGMLCEARQLRDDLVVVAMSATVDAAGLAEVLGVDEPAPVVSATVESHALQVNWAPPAAPPLDARGVTPAFLKHVGEVARVAWRESTGDVLIFLPGVREVQRVAEPLRGSVDADVLELHGQVSARDQDRAVGGREAGGRRRIIVSTALAESSLTVDGVQAVVDAGLSREPRRDAGRGMTGLVTVTCARSSADQRAGRAARQGPGAVWRCYDERAYAAMRPQVAPEIATSDLTDALLSLACWGSPRGEGLALPSPPPAAAVRDAEQVLRGLGAVDANGRATAHGRVLAEVPVGARWAHALVAGAPRVGPRKAAEIVAAVELDDRGNEPDLARRLSQLRNGSGRDVEQWRREVTRLTAVAERHAAEPDAALPRPSEAATVQLSEAAGLVVALAYPERIARRSGASYLFASGTRAAATGALGANEWLAVADVGRAGGISAAGTGAVIRRAAAIDESIAREAGADLLVATVRGELAEGRLLARRVEAIGAIELSSTPVSPRELGAGAVAGVVRERGLDVIGWSAAADGLRRRLGVLHRYVGDPWPNVSDGALVDRLDEWLAPELAQAVGQLSAIDLHDPLRRLLPWPEASRLDELVPERLRVPSGSRIALTYPPPESTDAVVCAVKLQECFGLAQSPRIVDGRATILFHLLSPARRPLAVTDDLESFWAGPYAQVRAEMRGRYPKHPWPEDPWSAPATTRTKRRGAPS